MTAVPPNGNPHKTEQLKFLCHYCKKPGHVFTGSPKRMKKEKDQKNDPLFQNTKTLTSKTFAPSPHCQRTKHPPEKNWSGPNAANRAKRFKQDQPIDKTQDPQEHGNLTDS